MSIEYKESTGGNANLGQHQHTSGPWPLPPPSKKENHAGRQANCHERKRGNFKVVK